MKRNGTVVDISYTSQDYEGRLDIWRNHKKYKVSDPAKAIRRFLAERQNERFIPTGIKVYKERGC